MSYAAICPRCEIAESRYSTLEWYIACKVLYLVTLVNWDALLYRAAEVNAPLLSRGDDGGHHMTRSMYQSVDDLGTYLSRTQLAFKAGWFPSWDLLGALGSQYCSNKSRRKVSTYLKSTYLKVRISPEATRDSLRGYLTHELGVADPGGWNRWTASANPCPHSQTKTPLFRVTVRNSWLRPFSGFEAKNTLMAGSEPRLLL